MPTLRCLKCGDLHGLNFDATPGDRRCPACKSPAKVVEQVNVHFVHPHPAGTLRGEGGERLGVACDPTTRRVGRHSPHAHLTIDTCAVTCPKCLASEAYKTMRAVREEYGETHYHPTQRNHPDAEVPTVGGVFGGLGAPEAPAGNPVPKPACGD